MSAFSSRRRAHRKSNRSPAGDGPAPATSLISGCFAFSTFANERVALDVLRPPLLVADAEHLQVERRRMPHRGPPAAPALVDRAVGELDQVERVLDVGIERVERRQLARVELAGHAAVEDRQRLGADVLGQLEVLEEAEPERLVVVGRGRNGNSSFQRLTIRRRDRQIADRRLPLIAAVEEPPLDDAAAGEAEEARASGPSSSCTRSVRRPFGRLFQVSAGNSETMSTSTLPGPSTSTRKRARAVVGSAHDRAV